MKKVFAISILAILFLFIIVVSYNFKRATLPKAPPDITVTYKQYKIETIKGFYNWFSKKDGGNSSLPDIPENLAKSLKTETVKKGEKINFSFDTSLKQPSKVMIYLIVPNESSKQNFGLVEQKLNGNSFVVLEESGEHIFMITGFWDETHSVDYVFKLNIQ